MAGSPKQVRWKGGVTLHYDQLPFDVDTSTAIHPVERQARNRRTIVNVQVCDGTGRMDVVFFNQPWREKQLKEGLQVALFGKVPVLTAVPQLVADVDTYNS